MTSFPIILNDPNDLIEFVSSETFVPELLNNVTLGDGFNLQFKISGENWHGRFDYRVGRFIYDLQRDIFTLYQEVTGEKISYRNRYEDIEKVLVTVEVQDGSLAALVELKDAITWMVKKMSGQQIVQAAAAGVLIVTIWCGKEAFVSWNDRQTEAARIAKQLKIEEGREETVRLAIESLARSSTAVTNLVAKMDERDSFSFERLGGGSVVLSADQIKANLPEAAVVVDERIRSCQVWGDFKITKQDYNNFTFTLTSDGVPAINGVSCSFPNSDAETEFLNLCSAKFKNSETPSLRLRLAIAMDGNHKIQNATILEMLQAEPTDTTFIREALAPLPE
jgi:hypothetical protein